MSRHGNLVLILFILTIVLAYGGAHAYAAGTLNKLNITFHNSTPLTLSGASLSGEMPNTTFTVTPATISPGQSASIKLTDPNEDSLLGGDMAFQTNKGTSLVLALLDPNKKYTGTFNFAVTQPNASYTLTTPTTSLQSPNPNTGNNLLYKSADSTLS